MRCRCFFYQLLPKRAEPGQSLALGKRPKQQPSKKKKERKEESIIGRKKGGTEQKKLGRGRDGVGGRAR